MCVMYYGMPYYLQGSSVTVSTEDLEQNRRGVINCIHRLRNTIKDRD